MQHPRHEEQSVVTWVVCDNSEISPPPKEATKVSDLVMMDVTPQEKKPVNFEEQLQEIDSAINDDVMVQELTGINELKKFNRGGSGFSNIHYKKSGFRRRL